MGEGERTEEVGEHKGLHSAHCQCTAALKDWNLPDPSSGGGGSETDAPSWKEMREGIRKHTSPLSHYDTSRQ